MSHLTVFSDVVGNLTDYFCFWSHGYLCFSFLLSKKDGLYKQLAEGNERKNSQLKWNQDPRIVGAFCASYRYVETIRNKFSV